MHLTAGRGVSSTVKAIAVASVVLLATCSDPFGPTVHEEILPSQQLQHGFKTTCLLNAAGEAVCWGETGGVFTPPSDTPAGFVALSVGSATCGLTQDGRAFCWGANSEGAVGDGTQTRRTTPTAVATEERFVTIRAGSRGTCALTGKGRAFCWGDNLRGSLGNGRMGSRERSLTPIPVSTSRPFKELGGMGPLKCGLGQDGRAFCWGTIGGTFGEDFQVQGDCDDFYYVWFTGRQCLTPTPVAGDRSFSQIVSGVTQCALTDGGDAFCWGTGPRGTLGNGAFGINTHAFEPVKVKGGLTFQGLAAGGQHMCGLTVEGVAYCWGNNFVGQLGIGSDGLDGGPTPIAAEPVPVAGDHRFSELSALGFGTCGLKVNGEVWCWGSGNLGRGDTDDQSSVPVRAEVPGG